MVLLCPLWFSSNGVNLCQSADDDAGTQRKQRRRERKEVDAKDSKKKPQITQISADFFCEICDFNNQIGENLCQSVDGTAKHLYRDTETFTTLPLAFIVMRT